MTSFCIERFVTPFFVEGFNVRTSLVYCFNVILDDIVGIW